MIGRVLAFTVCILIVMAPGAISAQSSEPAPADAEQPAAPTLSLLDGPLMEGSVGTPVELRVRLDGADPDEVQVFYPQFPEGISAVGNPTLVSRGLRSLELRIQLVSAVAGRFIVEGIEIASATTPREIEPALFAVAPAGGGETPFRMRWKVLSGEFIQSQSVPVVLEIVGADRYLFPDEIAYRAPETGLFEEVGGIGEVTTREIAGVTIYNIPVAAFLFTPATAGEVTIPSAEVGAGGLRAEAPRQTLSITPLPDTAVSSNAVGEFSIESGVDISTVERGDVISVELTVQGIGNLPVLDYPEVDAPGFEEVDRREQVFVEPDRSGRGGYRGYRTRTIRLENTGGSGETVITVGPFIYYDPLTGRTVRVPSRRHPVTVLAAGLETVGERMMPDLPLLTVPELMAPHWYHLAELPWLYYAFLIGPVVFVIVVLWSVRRGGPRRNGGAIGTLLGIVPFLVGFALYPPVDRVRLERAAGLISEDRPAVAAVLYQLELSENEWHGGVHYNRGVLGLRMDRPVIATYHLRRAVRLAPEQQFIRDALAEATDYFGLEEQIPIPSYVRQDYFVLTLIVLWTVFWIILASTRRLRNVLSLVGIGMVIVITLVAFVWTWNIDRQHDGVVREAVHVRRIPDESAVPWIGLATAQAVRIELRYQDFYLVRTRSGINGWVPRKTILTEDGSVR